MEGRQKKIVAILIAMIVIIPIIATVALFYKPEQIPTPTTFAFRDGDFFLYSINGIYNGAEVTGNYNVTLEHTENGYSGGYYSRVNISDSAAKARIEGMYPTVTGLMGVILVGVGKYVTAYGVKVIQYCFINNPNGLFEIDYFGINPFIVYGAVINGPDLHLEYVLNKTSNQYVISNNTAPIVIERNIFPSTNAGTDNFGIYGNCTILAPYYNENGGHLSFQLTGGKMDVYAFSEGNLRSMIEGGIFSYVSQSARFGVDNVSQDLVMPPGNYCISCVFHGPNERIGSYNWSVVWD